MRRSITPAQFQQYQQQWTQPVEDGDVEGHKQKTNAAYWVAYCYWYGTGGIPTEEEVWHANHEEAKRVLEQVIEEKDSIDGDNPNDNTGKHRYLLADLKYLPIDQTRADQLYCQAFQQLEMEVQQGGNDENFQEATSLLGECLFYGKGVGQDCQQGINWWKTAAELGHESAQYYIERKGFREPFIAEIVSWLHQIADQNNNPWARCQLAWCYEYGEGVKKDLVKAVEWYNKAISQGYDDATRYKQELLRWLSPEERSKTLGCVARNQKIEKARDLIQQSFVGAVPLGLWAHALASFQNQENPPWEAPSPTFLALSNGIM